MKRLGPVGWAYVVALLPLCVGSSLFWYSMYMREYWAIDAGIEVAAFFTILGWMALSVLVVAMAVVHTLRNGPRRWAMVPPVLIAVGTLPVIWLYGMAHDAMASKCFVRISKDLPVSHYWVWSDHFTTSVECDETSAHIMSFQQVYTYDWDADGSSGPTRSVSQVYLSIPYSLDSIVTYRLPWMDRGACQWLSLSEIVQEPSANTQRKRFPRVDL